MAFVPSPQGRIALSSRLAVVLMFVYRDLGMSVASLNGHARLHKSLVLTDITRGERQHPARGGQWAPGLQGLCLGSHVVLGGQPVSMIDNLRMYQVV
jgi:hypothetical protein